MSDFDTSRIDAAVEEFRASMPSVLPPGFDTVRSTVRHRQRVRVAVVAVAVAVVAISAGVLATPSLRGTAPMPGQTGTGTPPPSSVTGSPVPIYSGDPHPACDQAGGLQVPAGGIPLADLCDGTIDVPAWPSNYYTSFCPTGPLTFEQGAIPAVANIAVELGRNGLGMDTSLTYVDIDGDGDAETIVLLGCGNDSQVMAFDRAGDGTIHTIGIIVQTSAALPRLIAVQAGPAGQIQVEVADYFAGVNDDPSIAQHQTRVYRYDGTGFAQTGGATSFPPNPGLADMAVTSTALAFGPVVDGQRTATFTVAVHNSGPATATSSLQVDSQQLPLTVEPVDGCTTPGQGPTDLLLTCPVDLAGGASQDFTVVLHTAADAQANVTVTAQVSGTVGGSDPYTQNDVVVTPVTFA